MADGGREAEDVHVAAGPKRHKCILRATKGTIVAARIGVILTTLCQRLLPQGGVVNELSSEIRTN